MPPSSQAGGGASISACVGVRNRALEARAAALRRAFGAEHAKDRRSGGRDALRLMVGMGSGIAFAPALYLRPVAHPGGDAVARLLRSRSRPSPG